MFGDIGNFIPGVIDDPVHAPTLFRDGHTYYVFSTGVLNPAAPGGIVNYVVKRPGNKPVREARLEADTWHVFEPAEGIRVK